MANDLMMGFQAGMQMGQQFIQAAQYRDQQQRLDASQKREEALLQLKNPELSIAHYNQKEDTYNAVPVKLGQEGDDVRALAPGMLYNKTEDERLKDEMYKRKMAESIGIKKAELEVELPYWKQKKQMENEYATTDWTARNKIENDQKIEAAKEAARVARESGNEQLAQKHLNDIKLLEIKNATLVDRKGDSIAIRRHDAAEKSLKTLEKLYVGAPDGSKEKADLGVEIKTRQAELDDLAEKAGLRDPETFANIKNKLLQEDYDSKLKQYEADKKEDDTGGWFGGKWIGRKNTPKPDAPTFVKVPPSKRLSSKSVSSKTAAISEHQKAIDYANELLQDDPTNQQAIDMLRIAQQKLEEEQSQK